jgi:4-hydroxythreonine-4-phosphate dehydrogenase
VLLDFPTIGPGDYPVGRVSSEAGRATFETLRFAVELARSGHLDGFVFAPLNKEAMHLGGNPHNSELSFFRVVFEMPDISNELNFVDELWTTRVTSHIAIEEVARAIRKDRVLETIRYMDRVLRDYGHAKPRIAVAALNPHAGEHGLFGREEIDEIEPAVKEARGQGIEANGPFPADTIFLRVKREQYDGVVSMYHDQGQIAMKLMGFDRGVTVAGGLPVAITTPAHGTAHDIAGQGRAHPGAIVAAFTVAKRLVMNSRAASGAK